MCIIGIMMKPRRELWKFHHKDEVLRLVRSLWLINLIGVGRIAVRANLERVDQGNVAFLKKKKATI